jgi:hypothetical protein
MTIIALLFCVALVIALGVGALVLVSPLLLGFGILVMINAAWLSQTNKMASAPWNVVTVGVALVALGMLVVDMTSKETDMGPLPFVILLIYGVIAIIVAAITAVISRRKRDRAAKAAEKEPLEDAKEDPAGPSYEVASWKLQETWEDYPLPDYDAIHTYCLVKFDESGRAYYYRTRNPDLAVGDAVYVPVGYQYEKKIGIIISREDYLGHEVPYPLEKTRYIIGKAQ